MISELKIYSSPYNVFVPLLSGQIVLINTLYGALDIIDKEHQEKMLKPHLLDSETREYLLSRGYLTTEMKQKESLVRLEKLCAQRYKKWIIPHYYVFLITYNCNLACTYCYEREIRKESFDYYSKKMTKKQVDLAFKGIEALEENTKVQKIPIRLYGGECLLPSNYEIINYILEVGNDNNFIFDVDTNGTHLASYVDLLAKYNTQCIFVTLNGVEKVHNSTRVFKGGQGSFDRVIEGIEAAYEHNIPVIASINANIDSLTHLPELFEYAQTKEWGATVKFRLNLIRNLGCNKSTTSPGQFFSAFTALVRDQKIPYSFFLNKVPSFIRSAIEEKKLRHSFWSCPCNGKILIFDSHGYLYSCYGEVGASKRAIGRFDPGMDIWEDKFTPWKNRTVLNIPECRNCNLAFICGAGCGHVALTTTNKLEKPDCEYTKAVVKHVLPLYLANSLKGLT